MRSNCRRWLKLFRIVREFRKIIARIAEYDLRACSKSFFRCLTWNLMSGPVTEIQPTSGRRGLLSIVLPAYNEQEVLPLTHSRFAAMEPVFKQWGLDHEIIFVNDGSKDRTPDILNEFASRDPHVRVVHLARNFGHQAAVSAGLSVARGDVVAVMDCDLQDPPEVLPQFLAKWREGVQVVYSIRQKRKKGVGEGFA